MPHVRFWAEPSVTCATMYGANSISKQDICYSSQYFSDHGDDDDDASDADDVDDDHDDDGEDDEDQDDDDEDDDDGQF